MIRRIWKKAALRVLGALRKDERRQRRLAHKNVPEASVVLADIDALKAALTREDPAIESLLFYKDGSLTRAGEGVVETARELIEQPAVA